MVITVNTKSDAWFVINSMSDTIFGYDKQASECAGYDIFRSDDFYTYVCDLGSSLELNISHANKLFESIGNTLRVMISNDTVNNKNVSENSELDFILSNNTVSKYSFTVDHGKRLVIDFK